MNDHLINQKLSFYSSSSLKSHFINNRLLEMVQSGLIAYWRKRLWPPERQCDPSDQKYGPRPLNLDSFQSPFLVWGIGAALALVAFVVENLFFIISHDNKM